MSSSAFSNCRTCSCQMVRRSIRKSLYDQNIFSLGHSRISVHRRWLTAYTANTQLLTDGYSGNHQFHNSCRFSFSTKSDIPMRNNVSIKEWSSKLKPMFMNNHLHPYHFTTSSLHESWSRTLALQALHQWMTKKVPKGFEDFFQDKDTSTPKEPLEQEQASNSKKDNNTVKDEKLSSQDESKRNEKNTSDKKNKDKKSKNSGDDFYLNEALIALLLIALISSVSNESTLEEEITFADFRNRFLLKGAVEKLVVVNESVAKVVLKPEYYSGAIDSAALSSGTTLNSMTANSGSPGVDSSDGAIMLHDDSTTWSSTPASTNRSRSEQSKKNKPTYFFYIGSIENLEDKLTKAQSGIHPTSWIEVQYIEQTSWASGLLHLLPIMAFVAAFFFGTKGLMSGAAVGGGSSGPGGIFSIGKSTHKRIKPEDVNVTFADVAGCDQAKLEIMEFVDFLKDSERFTKLGAKIPKGALLSGPPGTGKTLLARATAGEAGVPFFSISGSDFLEMFVGVGPSRVRDLFKEARANAPCIVFIDEIDAVGRQRGRGGFSGGNDERENTLNQMLVEMDGFSPTTGIVVLAGTNRVDTLDQALTRPGRFDRQVVVDKPDLQGRKEIFKIHLKGITLEEGKSEEYAGRLAGLTPGFVGADIANICNEAAIVAARRKAESVSMTDFEKAIDRIIGGMESNKLISPEERAVVAHHEAGHAVAGWFLEHADPLLKVTIIPRSSGALGFAQYLPKEVFLRNQDQIMDIVCMTLAGRAAEEVFFGKVTTGASDDLRRVTQIVYSLIKDFGMNEKIGQLAFPTDDNNENPFGGSDRPYSDSVAEAMDDEARSIVDEAYKRTVRLIELHKDHVAQVAKLLLDKETITHDDIQELIGARPFTQDKAYQEYVSSKDYKSSPKVADTGKDKSDETESITEQENGTNTLAPGLA